VKDPALCNRAALKIEKGAEKGFETAPHADVMEYAGIKLIAPPSGHH